MDGATESSVGEPEAEVETEEPIYGAGSRDHHTPINTETGRSDLPVRKESIHSEDDSDYIPGPFTFIPECEMRPESSSWQQTFDKCRKNPGHLQFLTIYEFLKDPGSLLRTLHPEEETQEELVRTTKDVVYHFSKLTSKVTSFHTSEDRPKCFPGTRSKYPFYGVTGAIRHATGSLASCLVPQEGECMCWNCMESESKEQKYWLCLVRTATHGVCNLEEAKNSSFDFFDIDNVIADQDEVMKEGNRDNDLDEVKDRTKVMTDWEVAMEERAMTIEGTGITISDFEKRRKDYIDVLLSQSDDVRKSPCVDFALEDGRFVHDLLSHLKLQSEHPFAGDMNVVVCVTHDEEIATMLGTAWTDWIQYIHKHKSSLRDMSEHYTPMVSFPHGGPMVASVGAKPEEKDVGLKELIVSGNDYLDSHHTQSSSCFMYNVISDTDNALVPDDCWFYPPRPLCQKDFEQCSRMLTLPARTEVETLCDDSEGYRETEYSLRKPTDIPLSSVTAGLDYLYLTYETPTCPGSSGALLSYSVLYFRYSHMTHSGATGRANKNKSGIRIIR